MIKRENKAKLTHLAVVASAFVLMGWWISDIPIGYYRFQKICKKEGGLRTYGKVQPAEGWQTQNESVAKWIVSTYPSVPFARYPAADGSRIDVSYLGNRDVNRSWWDGSYSVVQASQVRDARYRLISELEPVASSIRLRKHITLLVDESSNQTVFQFTRFSFTWTKAENTLLGRSESMECPSYKGELSAIQSFLNSNKD